MGPDITNVLKDWPFQPNRMNVRILEASDGEPRLQVRLPLGMLQMHVEGRPDGLRPSDYPVFTSLLEAMEAERDAFDRDRRAEFEHAEETDESNDLAFSGGLNERGDNELGLDAGDERYSIPPERCQQLREEAMLYYQRYVALQAVGDFDSVYRDTQRNLRAIDFCGQWARDQRDRTMLERHRPFTLMMRARAVAGMMLRTNENAAAVLAMKSGVAQIKSYLTSVDREDTIENSPEIRAMEAMILSLTPKPTLTQDEELQRRLDEALSTENYELAAILRDEIKSLRHMDMHRTDLGELGSELHPHEDEDFQGESADGDRGSA